MTLPEACPLLLGARTRLRAFDSSDLDLVIAAADDPLIPMITTVPTSRTRADAAAYVERQRGRSATGEGYSFAVVDRASGEAVGQIGLWTRELDQGRANVGYWIAPPFRRRGLASDALATLTSWAFTLDAVQRVQLFVEPWNEASWRAAEACGYEREGLLRSYQQIGDRRRDLYLYARLA